MTAADEGGLALAVRERLSASGAVARLRHVENVVATIRSVAAEGEWSAGTVAAAERAAWYHDALKPDPVESLIARIEAVGESPDPWMIERAGNLLHAHAAAVWAATDWDEADVDVLEAVRHHPTGHPELNALGCMLYVADFCEPGRTYAATVGTTALLAMAATGPDGLARTVREVLAHRIAWLRERGQEIHPLTEAWHIKLNGRA